MIFSETTGDMMLSIVSARNQHDKHSQIQNHPSSVNVAKQGDEILCLVQMFLYALKKWVWINKKS